jgi:elongation factor Ts
VTDPERIPAAVVKRLRDLTGAGMMDCKQALIEAGGDLQQAQELLRTRGLASAKKRSGRRAGEGVVDAYIHGDGRIGVLVEMNSETDFVARTDDFRRLAREVAMQIAATDPRWISRSEVPAHVTEGERKIYEEQARATGKPDGVVERIVDGKLEAFFRDSVLMEQAYVRDPDRTIGDLVSDVGARVGENVVVRRFSRFVLGAED